MKVADNKSIPLGETVTHSRTYNPEHLFPVRRSMARELIGIDGDLPFVGSDTWNAYEISWLDPKGKPVVAIGEIAFPCTTENIVESKSLKLYLNSFNQSVFDTPDSVASVIEKDLSECVNGEVTINLMIPSMFGNLQIQPPAGVCIDDLDLNVQHYHVDKSTLKTEEDEVVETLHSNLLRTNCPVTQQPDWATVIIEYKGKKIDRKGLLAYIVSYREHTGFHENCVESIFADILATCSPRSLSVYARFTRRGGIDINPFRSTHTAQYENTRLARQ